MNRTVNSVKLRKSLEPVLAAQKVVDRLATVKRDPVQFPRRYTLPTDREIAALLSALLAFGRVEIILAKLEDLFTRLGKSPSETIRVLSPEQLHERLKSFRHRTFVGADIARLLVAVNKLIAQHGRVFTALERSYSTHEDLRLALTEYVHLLYRLGWNDQKLPSTAKHLLPDPERGSGCKRWLLLLRWIARKDDGVDLGLVNLPASALLIPLDVHVHRISLMLGLTSYQSPSWASAVEVTNALKVLDADDPVRFDFALCHAQIAAHRQQKKRRDL